jgi:hypothetical protein
MINWSGEDLSNTVLIVANLMPKTMAVILFIVIDVRHIFVSPVLNILIIAIMPVVKMDISRWVLPIAIILGDTMAVG